MNRKLTKRALYKAVTLLNTGKFTRTEVAAACEISESTLYRYIRAARAQQKEKGK